MTIAVPEDLVVVVPGVTGSSLADMVGKEVWGLGAGSLLRALKTLGRSLRDLSLPDGFAEGPAPDGVFPTGLIMGFHGIPGVWTPLEGYRGLVNFLLRASFDLTLDSPNAAGVPAGNLVLFAYDWRLSNRWTAQLLKSRVERTLTRWRESAPQRRDAKVVFICHSMGGLVARWYVERDGGAEITRSLVTIGTPHRGALTALEQLVNGVRRGPPRLRLDLTSFARSLPSSYELLPEYACIEGPASGNPEAPLAKATEHELPELSKELVAAGMAFHEELDKGDATMSYTLLPVLGIGQPTSTTAYLEEDRVVPLLTIEGRDLMGDGTVPRLAARPKRLAERDPSIKAVAEGHGALPGHRSVLEQLAFSLTAEDTIYRAAEPRGEAAGEEQALGVSVPDVHEVGERVEVTVRAAERRLLQVAAMDERGRQTAHEIVRFHGIDDAGRKLGTAAFERLGPGGYSLVAGAPDDPGGLEVPPVRATTLVLDET